MSVSECVVPLLQPYRQLATRADVAVSGSAFHVAGSPSLAHIIQKTAKDVPHPTNPKKSLWEASQDTGPFEGTADVDIITKHDVSMKRKAPLTNIQPLGSGSDFTVFLQRLGVRFSSSFISHTLPNDWL